MLDMPETAALAAMGRAANEPSICRRVRILSIIGINSRCKVKVASHYFLFPPGAQLSFPPRVNIAAEKPEIKKKGGGTRLRIARALYWALISDADTIKMMLRPKSLAIIK